MRTFFFALLLVVFVAGGILAANSYDVEKVVGASMTTGIHKINVTREDKDVYKINNVIGNAYVITKYCYEHCYNKDVFLEITSTFGTTIGKIHF